jgi:hypothetical protein
MPGQLSAAKYEAPDRPHAFAVVLHRRLDCKRAAKTWHPAIFSMNYFKRIMIIVLVPFGLAAAIAVLITFEERRRLKYNDADERFITRYSLSEIGRALNRFIKTSDALDRKAIQAVRTLEELWALVHKKIDFGKPIVPGPSDENYPVYIRDGWKKRYVLELKVIEDVTVIRISSTGKGKDLFVEASIDEHGGYRKQSWDP